DAAVHRLRFQATASFADLCIYAARIEATLHRYGEVAPQRSVHRSQGEASRKVGRYLDGDRAVDRLVAQVLVAYGAHAHLDAAVHRLRTDRTAGGRCRDPAIDRVRLDLARDVADGDAAIHGVRTQVHALWEPNRVVHRHVVVAVRPPVIASAAIAGFVAARVLVPEGADDGIAITVDAACLHAHLIRIATAPALVDNHLGAIPAAGLHGDSTVHVMQVQPAARLHHLAPLQSHYF